MSDDADSFRVQARLNNVEFADIKADLDRYDGAQRTGRIRLFLRLGYAAATNPTFAAELTPIVDTRPSESTQSPTPAGAKRSDDSLARFGLDVTAFQFGGDAS